MNKTKTALAMLLLAGMALPALAQTAEDAQNACSEAAQLIVADDLDAALEEAQWCVESLLQMKQDRTLSIYPDSVDDYLGGELSNQSAMGITVLERVYQKDNHSVTVSLTGGIAGGGMAALAQLGMGLTQSAGKKLRVQKRTVINLSDNAGGSEYMVQLKSGGMLMISSSTLNDEELLVFVKAFPIADLDDALE